MRSLPSLLLVVSAFFSQADVARSQPNYPNRPIQLVVTVPPGGAADLVGRLIGSKLADALGQTVVISNRGGAGGTTAAAQVAKSDPDGYTLLLNTIATHGIGPHIYANLPYDPVKDFSPVILIAKLPLIMAVNAELPAQSVKDVIALAKAKPGELTFPITRQNAEAVLTVTDSEIIATMKFILFRMKMVVEPSGAAAAAAVFTKKLPQNSRRVGVVLSGGNVDRDVLAEILKD